MIDLFPPEHRPLYLLARQYGVQPFHWSVFGERVLAPPDSVLAVLQVLGAPLESTAEVGDALRARRSAVWQRLCPPVIVAWDGGPTTIVVRLPSDRTGEPLRWRLVLESGAVHESEVIPAGLRTLAVADTGGRSWVAKELPLPGPIELGYHRCTLSHAGRRGTALLIAAPARLPASAGPRGWGVFLPLYALRTEQDWGIGGLGDLGSMLDWVTESGGAAVGTLPLLSVYAREPMQTSPYSPASRLFWNELYVDIPRLPELDLSPAAKQRLAAADLHSDLSAMRAASLVDYGRVAALKRELLEELSLRFFASSTGNDARRSDFERYLAEKPEVRDYARYRAVVDRQGGAWPSWPATMRAGELRPGDFDERLERHHLYAQWVAARQIEELGAPGAEPAAALYLDLPVGVPYNSYDVWRFRDTFAETSTGAPPDTFFLGGQDWGFPPPHPERVRADGYSYFIKCLRHHLSVARMLRIDHIMGLHRLYWVPDGATAKEGVYVRYEARETYAILCLEAQRSAAAIVGEDLGTVPNPVRRAMARHGIWRTYVLQTELRDDPSDALPTPAAESLACVNTHDMPTFAAFLEGSDIDDLEDLGQLDEERAARERAQRNARTDALVHFLATRGYLEEGSADASSLLRACLRYLADCPAHLVVVNLEDLWHETRPQNVPGTTTERPNWQRRALLSFKEMRSDPRVESLLEAVDCGRRGVFREDDRSAHECDTKGSDTEDRR